MLIIDYNSVNMNATVKFIFHNFIVKVFQKDK